MFADRKPTPETTLGALPVRMHGSAPVQYLLQQLLDREMKLTEVPLNLDYGFGTNFIIQTRAP